MTAKFPASIFAHFFRTAGAAVKSKKSVGPIRLTIVSAVLLSALVVIGTGIYIYDLRDRVLTENERSLSNVALIVAKQVQHIFTTVEAVQKQFLKQIVIFENIDEEDFERRVSQRDIHLKLRDTAAGMPYVASLTVINAQGRLINFSRQWPIPNIDVSDRNFFEAFQSDPNLTSFISEPIRNRANGSWVVHMARKISGTNGEFLGLISAAIELQYIQNIFGQVASGLGNGISLLRGDGTLLARIPDDESNIGRRFPDSLGLKLTSAAEHGVGVGFGAMSGELRVIAGHRVSGYPVVVVTTKTTATILANWKRTATSLVFAAALSILAIAAFAILFVRLFKNYQALVNARAERENAEKLRDKSLQFDVALNNMSQGLAMFDSSERIILCNRRYIDMYGLPPEAVTPGRTLRELLHTRQALGSFPMDIEKYRLELLNDLSLGKTTSFVIENFAGRSFRFITEPMAGGGWVGTHEDVTEKVRAEKVIELQTLQIDAALKNMSQGLCMFDASQRLIVCNKRYAELYGLDEEQTKPGVTLRAILEHRIAVGSAPDDHETYINERIAEVTARKSYQTINRLSDGRYVSVVHRPMVDGGWVATHEDVTEAKHREEELRRTKKFIDAVIEHMPLPIIVKDVVGLEADASSSRFTLFNRAYEELTGDNRDQLIGKTAHQIYPKERADLIIQADNETLRSDKTTLTSEHPILTSHKGTRLVTARKTVIRDHNGKPEYLLTVVDDVTERRQAEQRITYLAHNDSLTDLPNRATFVDYLAATLDEALKTGEQFAVLCIDLDRFKEANDVYGHLVGDCLLRDAACRLQAAAQGVFLARVGGDEFTLVVKTGPLPASAAAIGERLLAAFQDDFHIDDHKLRLSLSIGVAIYPTDGADANTLINNADAALYQAKAETRGSVRFFATELGVQMRERRNVLKDLQIAITRNEFLLHYQPQEKIATTEIIGFEALVRWQCPKRGLVAPGIFIPLAEESRLIIPMGEWILREACREAATWPLPLTIAVNISPVQFHYGDLPNLVHSILLETGLAPARLELEITEGVLIDDFSRAVSILGKLKSLGVQIAMDDFGTGYSSLSYLHSFPFDKIKIDRSFIGDLEHNHHSMAVVRAIVTLGHSLDVPVLAEGVETQAQHLFLAQEGCDEVQGFLTGRPQMITDYAKLVGRQTTDQNNCEAVTS